MKRLIDHVLLSSSSALPAFAGPDGSDGPWHGTP